MNFLIIHGMSGKEDDHWYPWLDDELTKLGHTVDRPTFPNNLIAPKDVLLEFALERITGKNTVLIGHSSGSSLALRIAEKVPIEGSVLVSCLYEDLGYEDEVYTELFVEPWDWDTIKKNQKWIVQIDSDNDPYIPTNHFNELESFLGSQHIVLENRRHFGDPENSPLKFPELLKQLINKNLQ